jgi:hypothetical protein
MYFYDGAQGAPLLWRRSAATTKKPELKAPAQCVLLGGWWRTPFFLSLLAYDSGVPLGLAKGTQRVPPATPGFSCQFRTKMFSPSDALQSLTCLPDYNTLPTKDN